MAAGSAPLAALSLKITVLASGVSMLSTPAKVERAAAAVFSSAMRSKVYLTSSEVIACPLWNLTPLRNTIVRVLASSLSLKDSARFGITFMSLSKVSRGS